MNSRYLRYELLRTVRNRRFFFLSLGFPLALYFLIAESAKSVHRLAGTGLSAPTYFMVGLISFGTMGAMLSCGVRIAAERAVGWNRQLRISPLTTRAYFRAKLITAYLMAILSIAALYAAGLSLGVSMPLHDWVQMTLLILVCLVPFAALGIVMGHMLMPESIGPAMGGSVALFAFLGGSWFPLSSHGVLNDVGQLLPSYWLVQSAHVSLGAHPMGTKGWIVIAVWTAVLVVLARSAYRRDTGRV